MANSASAGQLAGVPTAGRAAIAVAVALVVVIGVLAVVAVATGVVPLSGLPDTRATPQIVGHLLLVATVLLVTLGVVHDAEGYLAGIWLASTLGPWIAASAAIVTYLLTEGWSRSMDVRFAAAYNGIAAALAFVAGAAFLGRQLSRPERAQPRTWESLVDRLSQLKARVSATWDQPPAGLDDGALRRFTAQKAEASSLLETVTDHVCDKANWSPALRWALATGYSSVQRTLHRLDEMLIESEPDASVTGDALHDALSLSGSTIADRDVLTARLRTAMQTISPNAFRFFFPVTGAPSGASPGDQDLPSKEEAREVLREVRYSINEFRDDRVDGLIRSRNRLLWVVLTVGITAYCALAIGLLSSVSETAVASFSVVYLVGALSGLVNRLRIESSRSSAVEDYGLHLARLIATPLLSGLAAVAGVYLVAKTPELLTVVSPSTAATPEPLDISQIFDLAANQSALVVAAVFGLVPAQLFSGLQRQAERFQLDLEKSAPAGESTLSAGNQG